MNSGEFARNGELATGAPHIRLAGLRLGELARDVRNALATPPAGSVEADLDFPDWADRVAPRAQLALSRLGENLERLGECVLLGDRPLSVVEVDNAINSLREDLLALLALRDAAALRRFGESMRPHAQEAVERIASRLRDLGRACSLLSATILHPDRMLADDTPDLGVSLDLDLAHELRAIAAAARGPAALWRYC